MRQNFSTSINYTGNAWSLLWQPLLGMVPVILILVIWLSGIDGLNFWDSFAQNENAVAGTYCENNRLDEFIRQPSNTWSNLGYLFYGLICFKLAWHDYKNKPRKNIITVVPVISVLYGISFAYLCFGSFFFHASLTLVGQHWDMAATYNLTAFPIIILAWQINMARLKFTSLLESKKWQRLSAFMISLTFIAAVILFYVFKWSLNSTYAMPGIIIVVILLVIAYQVYKKNCTFAIHYALLAWVFVIAAFVIWYQDRAKIWCDPDSIIQGHAAWHFLTGLGALFIYFWMRSETPIEPKAPEA